MPFLTLLRSARRVVSVAVLGLVGGATVRGEDATLAARGRAFLEKHCFECHSQSKGKKQEDPPGIDYADRAALIAPRDEGEELLLVPGKPDESLIWKQVETKKMPKGKGRPKPGPEESAAFRRWIEAGAEFPGPTDPPRQSRSDLDELADVAAYLRTLPEQKRPLQRFFSIRGASNRPPDRVAPRDLQTLRMALSKAVNSLSTQEAIVVPKPIDRDGTVLAIDLHALGWDRRRLWNEVLKRYPYGLVPGDAAPAPLRERAREVSDLTGTSIPVVRADWFIANATRAPLYDLFLDLPAHVQDLEDRLGVEIEADFRGDLLRRAAVSKSKVSDFNRLVDRHRANHGYYWKSYDFRAEDGTSKLSLFPLGPVLPRHPFPRFAFEHAGGEIIFSLPNDLQGYLLVDSKGTKIDPGPIDIVHDENNTAGTPQIVNGLSCMGCHSRGMYSFVDTIRTGLAVQGDAGAKALRLFMTAAELSKVLKDDEARFVRALEQAVGPFRGPGAPVDEPISAAVGEYLKNVDLATAAAELDLPNSEPLRRLIEPRTSRLRRLGLGPLLDGGSLRRDTWESQKTLNSLFQEAARELGVYDPKPIF